MTTTNHGNPLPAPLAPSSAPRDVPAQEQDEGSMAKGPLLDKLVVAVTVTFVDGSTQTIWRAS